MSVRSGVRIGVDVGSVRIGLARSDAGGILATPVRTVSRAGEPEGPCEDDADVVEIAALVQAESAIEVVIGLPKTLAGHEGAAALQVRKYAAVLARCVSPVPVRLHDERLSTVDAHRALRESGVAGRRVRTVVDQAAAVIILQSALDAERSSGRPPGRPVGGRKPRSKDGRR